jgi:hypothetical protein
MSVQPMGNAFPKMGKQLPPSAAAPSAAYASAVAEVLASELKGTHRAIKTVAKWAGTSERTAKNWLSARRGPSGPHLIALLGSSDALLERILVLAGRGSVVELRRLDTLKGSLLEAIAAIDAPRRCPYSELRRFHCERCAGVGDLPCMGSISSLGGVGLAAAPMRQRFFLSGCAGRRQ